MIYRSYSVLLYKNSIYSVLEELKSSKTENTSHKYVYIYKSKKIKLELFSMREYACARAYLYINSYKLR